jgi:uncharacterized protein (TIGR00251 family)
MSITQTEDGTILKIFVKPNSSEFKIEFDDREIVVYSTEEPIRGKVNKEIIKELTKLLGFRIGIVSGLTSKQKVLLLKDAKKETVVKVLRSLTDKNDKIS